MHVEGREAVVDRILRLFGPGSRRTLIPVPIEGAPGFVAVDGGRVLAMFRLDERDGTIHHLHGFVRRPPAGHRP